MAYTIKGVEYADCESITDDICKAVVLCDVCGTTWGEHSGVVCPPYSKAAVAPQALLKFLPQPSTQKAEGIDWLRKGQSPFLVIPTTSRFFSNAFLKTIAQPSNTIAPCLVEAKVPFPLFMRPCPLRPRHGFVDSRVIYNNVEFQELAAETLAADPEAEMIGAPFIHAEYSAVATECNITYGKEHDGATSGRSCVSIPYPKISVHTIFPDREEAPLKESMYLELLFKGELTYAAQLRDGPLPSYTQDFIPRATTVSRILSPTSTSSDIWMSLMEWEGLVESAKDDKGVVIQLRPDSLTSHYGVHGVLNNIPVVCSHTVKVGDTLRVDQSRVDNEVAHDKFAAYLCEAFDSIPRLFKQLSNDPQLSAAMLASIGVSYLHSQALWDGQDKFLMLRAHGIAATIYCLYAALIGESRYSRCDDEKLVAVLQPMYKEARKCGYNMQDYKTRASLYTQSFALSIDKLSSFYPSLYSLYSSPRWSEGYGGLPWLNCTQAAHGFLSLVDEYITNPTQEKYDRIFIQWNRAINTVHNGGTPISKMNKNNLLICCLTSPSLAFLLPVTPLILFEKRALTRTKPNSIIQASHKLITVVEQTLLLEGKMKLNRESGLMSIYCCGHTLLSFCVGYGSSIEHEVMLYFLSSNTAPAVFRKKIVVQAHVKPDYSVEVYAVIPSFSPPFIKIIRVAVNKEFNRFALTKIDAIKEREKK